MARRFDSALKASHTFRNVLLVNSSADHLKVGDFGLSKLIKVQNSHDVYKMTGETGSCERYYAFIIVCQRVVHGIFIFFCANCARWKWQIGIWPLKSSSIESMTRRWMFSPLE